MTFIYLVKYQINERFKAKLPVPVPVEIIVVIISTLISYLVDFHGKYKVAVIGLMPPGYIISIFNLKLYVIAYRYTQSILIELYISIYRCI